MVHVSQKFCLLYVLIIGGFATADSEAGELKKRLILCKIQIRV